MIKAIGAVRCTAFGKRLAGSSKPKSCLQFSKVHSIAHRQAYVERLAGRSTRVWCSRTSGRTFPFQVANQHDREKSVAARRVVQGPNRLYRQRGMEAELVEFESVQGWFASSAHRFILGKRFPFLRGGPLVPLRLGGAGS